MRTSPEGLKLIQSSEDFSATVYYCSAHIATVGWGHALTTPTGQLIDYDVFGRAASDRMARDAMQRLFGKQSITVPEADALLMRDLERFEREVNRVVDATTHQCEFDAMVSFCFNVGTGAFRTSSVARLHRLGQRRVGTVSMSGLAAQSKAKAEPTTIQLAFARWSNSNGRWTLGLYRRRLAEIMVYGGRSAQVALDTAWSFRD